MNNKKIQKFNVIGISVRTTNENSQATLDIPVLRDKFFKENVIERIPNKIDSSIICIYTHYEKDHTKPYTTILGCKVENLNMIPDGMIGIEIGGGQYNKFIPKGNLSEGIVYKEWTKIWESDLNRTFTADFEVYRNIHEDSNDPGVEIFIAVN